MIFECPITTCEWTHEGEADNVTLSASNRAAAPGIAAVFGISTDALLDIHRGQALRRDETTLANHFRTHKPEEWVRDLMAARAEAAALRRGQSVPPATTAGNTEETKDAPSR